MFRGCKVKEGLLMTIVMSGEYGKATFQGIFVNHLFQPC